MRESFLPDDVRRVIELIRAAFQGVVLGDGIGLRQADGIDGYLNEQKLAELRSQDEKLDWSAIPSEDLDRYYVSLTFFDADGMRFHLPAYLIADLRGELFMADVLDYLTGGSRFNNFSNAQRSAVKEFLWLRLADAASATEHARIEAALLDYWMDEGD